MATEKEYHFDAIIIGTGPGGEGAAMNLAKGGKRVAVIERQQTVGGDCTQKGTIPSKALRHSVSRLIEYNTSPLFNMTEHSAKLTFSDILRYANQVIKKQVHLRTSFYDRNEVTIFHGHAQFIDPYTLKVTDNNQIETQLTAKSIIIATGARPYRPDDVDFSNTRIYDSNTILQLKNNPKHIIIYGAGVIGCEYASIFRGLGVKVDLINTRDRLLDFLDHDISDSLSYHFSSSGVVIRHGEEYAKIEANADNITIDLQSGKKMRADCLLYANGRTGNTDNLNLDSIGLAPDSRGQLKINEHYQTTISHIFAVGDVIGYPSLASAAFDQGRIAADAILHGDNHDHPGLSGFPAGIYTIPEISSIGKTERELTQEKIPYEVGRASFKHLARAQIAQTETGSLKILFHRETKEILGIHCFGERAAEIIHIGQAIMLQKGTANSIEYFIHTTFNYPTMAEAYRVAALNGLNRLF